MAAIRCNTKVRCPFDRHLRTDGAFKTYLRFATRYLAILGVGAILTAGQSDVAGMPANWGVLQAIGVAGLITLIVIRLNPWARVAVGLALLGLLLGFFALVPVPWWYADAPLWQTPLQLLALLAIISLIARALFTRKVVISI